MKSAISEELYERAAEIRDQIQQLERELQAEGPG
jgi:protein-arginine kinase activator protein McsA